jgi:M6 family metalloprotease-like protein
MNGENEMKKNQLFFLLASILVFLMTTPLQGYYVSQKAIGEQKILVIMTKFPDIDPSLSVEMMQDKYFDKLNRYLKAISYGKTWVTGKMTDWYTLPRTVGNYRLSQHNLKVEKERVMRLISDTINLADRDEDFSQYSMIFISLGAKLQDYGMMGLCGYPGMLGWHNQLPLKTKKRGQRIPGGVAIYCEQAHVGIVFHDMAHIMGGVQKGKRVLPCLYDHDLQSQSGSFRNHFQFYLINVGFFDPMSCHYYDLKKGPPGVCGWTKLRLNWIGPNKVAEVPRGRRKTISLGPLSRGQSEVMIVKLPIDDNTYYLIENRQAIGPDRNLPSHGVLIYNCDDRIPECRQGKSPIKLVNANPTVPHLKGAPFDFKGKSVYTDQKQAISVKIVGKQGEKYRISVSNGE